MKRINEEDFCERYKTIRDAQSECDICACCSTCRYRVSGDIWGQEWTVDYCTRIKRSQKND